jgi:hypothetical protein
MNTALPGYVNKYWAGINLAIRNDICKRENFCLINLRQLYAAIIYIEISTSKLPLRLSESHPNDLARNSSGIRVIELREGLLLVPDGAAI